MNKTVAKSGKISGKVSGKDSGKKIYLEKDSSSTYRLRIFKLGTKGSIRRSLQTKNSSEATNLFNKITENFSRQALLSQSTETFNKELEKIKQIIPDTISNLKFNYLGITSKLDVKIDTFMGCINKVIELFSIGDKTKYIIQQARLIEVETEFNQTKQSFEEFKQQLITKNLNDLDFLKYCQKLGFNTNYHAIYLKKLSLLKELQQHMEDVTLGKTQQNVMMQNIGVFTPTSDSSKNLIKQPEYTFQDIANKITTNKAGCKEPEIASKQLTRVVTNALQLKMTNIVEPERAEEYVNKLKNWLIAKHPSKSTLKHYKTAFTAFLNIIQYLYDDQTSRNIGLILTNFKDLKILSKDSVPYTAFTNDQLIKIFDFNNNFFKENPSDFWTCVIALFMGSRTNLAHTLCHSDIIQQNNVYCVKFTDDDITSDRVKKAKNQASKRTVPIHPQLLDLGFIEYINYLKQHHKDLDTDFIFEDFFNKAGHMLPNVNNKFFDFLTQIGIKNKNFQEGLKQDERYAFHSFRKSAAKHMRDCGVSTDYVNGLIGWEGENTQDKHYVTRNTIEELQKANSQFDYSFLKESFTKWKNYWEQQIKS